MLAREGSLDGIGQKWLAKKTPCEATRSRLGVGEGVLPQKPVWSGRSESIITIRMLGIRVLIGVHSPRGILVAEQEK